MSIMTFGSNQLTTLVYNVVRVGVATRDGGNENLHPLSVFFYMSTCHIKPIGLCMDKYQYLSDLELSDFQRMVLRRDVVGG